MPRVSIFFKYKVYSKLGLNNRFKNLIAIRRIIYFAIGITGVVKVKLALKVIPNSRLSIELISKIRLLLLFLSLSFSSLRFLCPFLLFLNIIRTIAFTRLAKDIYLSLRSKGEVYFV